MSHWSIYIDIEGFGETYQKGSQALVSLGALMEAIYRIGKSSFAESPNSIFAYQTGDGFVIVSEVPQQSLEQPLGLAIALLRHVLMKGGVAKAAISEGQFADVLGCYPAIIQDNCCHDQILNVGDGVMTIFPVMGTALINSHHVAKKESGSLLLVDRKNTADLPQGIKSQELGDIVVVDWVHSKADKAEQLLQEADLPIPGVIEMESKFGDYLKTVPECKWRSKTVRYLNLESGI